MFSLYKGTTLLFRPKFDAVTFTASTTWEVPKGIKQIRVDCVGAAGTLGSGDRIDKVPGYGGRVQAVLSVVGITTLYITVGTIPSSWVVPNYNASDVRIGTELTDRVIVAGGGGSGRHTSNRQYGSSGGNGGGLTGAAGTAEGTYGYPGQGGTQTAGGAGGSSSQRDSKWFYGPGAGGAGFAGIVELPAGAYTWKVGAAGYGWNINNQLNMSGSVAGGDSSLINTTTGETFILTGGAPANHEVWSTNGGTFTTAGGTISVKEDAIISFTKKSNGNSSAANNTPGASLYDGTLTGYGAGNNSYINGGTRYAVGGFVMIKAL